MSSSVLTPSAPWRKGANAPAPAAPTGQGAGRAWMPWSQQDAFAGRLCEISCDGHGGQSTLATTLVLAMQRAQEPVAWLQGTQGGLYPPDVAAHGVALEALVVVQVGDAQRPTDRVRAAEMLLQGGGFGLVVIDLTDGALPPGWGWQGRLLALARAHASCVVLLTRKAAEAPSLGAWVALRLSPQPAAPRAAPLGPGFFDVAAEVAKNKGCALAGAWRLQRRGPDGLL